MAQHDLVSKFIKLRNSFLDEELEKTYPEFSSSKSTMNCVLEKKTEIRQRWH